MGHFLKVKHGRIVNAAEKPVTLKGVNLGGWLMMEGYIMQAPNLAVRKFKSEFAQALGQSALRDFEKSFNDNFIREADIRRIADYGFNCLRLPFHHGLIETQPYRYDPAGLTYLDRLLKWARKYRLWVILDLHGAAGSQNHDWHSDSLGLAQLWHRKEFQERTFALWEFLAERYHSHEEIAGYDLLNEAVIADPKKLNVFYRQLIKRIRRVDPHHILFVEGNRWATDLACLDDFNDANMCLSIHCYVPLEFTFNFVPFLSYPLKENGRDFDRSSLRALLTTYQKIAVGQGRPVFVGEFGIHARQGRYGEDRWLKDILAVFDELGFHWTYWTYKAVKNTLFPDGILSYFDNPPWVRREGPIYGWDNYKALWPGRKKDIIRSWRTEYFKENRELLNVLLSFVQPRTSNPKK